MMHICLSGVDCFPPPPTPEEPGYTYSVLIEGFVRADTVFIHHVGSNGRVREAVCDRYGRRFKVPVTADLHAFWPVMQEEMAGMPGHYAFVARDADGKMRGRRDFWLWRDDAECARVMGEPAPTPMEELEQSLAEETRRREEAERALRDAHRAFERLRAQVIHRDRRIDELEARLNRRAKREERAAARRSQNRPTHLDSGPTDPAPGASNGSSAAAASRRRLTPSQADGLGGVISDAVDVAHAVRRHRARSKASPPTEPEACADERPPSAGDPCP